MKTTFYLIMPLLLIYFSSCTRNNQQAAFYQKVEALMAQRPDSALALLEDINQTGRIEKLSRKDKAHYYLLLTEAQDKNYLNHTTDSLISIATEYFEDTDDLEHKSKSWFYRGRINQDLGYLMRAQEDYLKALRDEQRIKDYALLGRIYNNVGMLYTSQMVHEKALPLQKKAVACFRLLEDSIGQVFALRDLGRSLKMLESRDSAIAYYQQAIALMGEGKVVSIYIELASLYIDKQKYLEAGELLQVALQCAKNPQSKYPIFLVQGRLYQQCNQLDSAQYYFQACEELAPTLETRAGGVYYLREIAFTQNKWEQFAQYSKRYESLRDSIANEQRTESMRARQTMFYQAQLENELTDSQLNISKVKQRNVYIVSLSCIILLCSAFYILHVRRERRMLCLRQKENEIQIARNERIIDDLENIQTESLSQLKELDTCIENLKQENHNLRAQETQKEERITNARKCELYKRFCSPTGKEYTPNDWDMLFAAVEEDHPKFRFNLQKDLPNLSEKEEKLCYLIKIGVKPTNISIHLDCDGISMMRKRLYEKMTGEEGNAKLFDKYISEL